MILSGTEMNLLTMVAIGITAYTSGRLVRKYYFKGHKGAHDTTEQE